jgi:endoglucanase
VQYRLQGSTTFTNFSSTTTATTQVVTGLNSAATYDFQVYAFNAAGNGPVSSIVTGGTIAANSPSAVTGLTFTSETNTTISLSWTAPTSGTTTPTPPVPTPTPQTSPSGTIVTAIGQTIVDLNGSAWTLTSGQQIAVNGVADTTTANVVEIAYVNSVIYQLNASGSWFSKTLPNGTWIASTSPFTSGTTASKLLTAGPLFTGTGSNKNQIVDANGVPQRIASVCWAGSESGAGWIGELTDGNYKSMIDCMKSEGFNTFRLQTDDVSILNNSIPPNGSINYSLNPDLQGLNVLQVVVKIVTYAGSVGMRAIIDSHCNEGGLGQQSNGLWYDSGNGQSTDGSGQTGTITQAKFVQRWQKVATALAGNPGLLGYDIRNEPLAYTGMCTWGDGGVNDIRAMYQTVGNAIQAIDATPLIICEGPQNYNNNFLGGVGAPEGDLTMVATKPVVLNTPNKVVYSVHCYPATVGGVGPDINRWMTNFGYLFQQNIAPVFIGECGSRLLPQADKDWANIFVPFCNGQASGGITLSGNQLGFSTSWFCWGVSANPSGIGGDFGVTSAVVGGTLQTAQAPFLRALQFNNPGTTVPVATPAPTSPTPTPTSTPSFTYQVQYRISGASNWTNFPSIATGTSQVIGSLTANTSYDFRVFAINAAGNGPPSSVISVSTLTSAGISAVTNLTASAINNAGLTLSWTAPTGTGTTGSSSGPVPVTAPLTGTVTAGTWQQGTTSNGTAYGYLLPAQYDGTKSYPLVLYLHQFSWGSFGFAYLRDNQINAWFNNITFRTAYPCIILAPLCYQGSDGGNAALNWGGVSTDPQAAQDGAIALVRTFLATYPVNPAKVYVTGNSMGGLGSWDIIVKYNRLTGTQDQLFAAAMPLAGATYTYGDNGQSGSPNASVVTALKNVPIWAIHGGQDTTVPLRWDREMYAAEQAAGGLMKYFEDASSGHDVWDTYYVLPAGNSYYSWLFQQSLGAGSTGPSTSYQVQYRITNQSGWTNYSPQTTQTSQIITGLVASTSYDFDVYPITSTGNGPQSAIVTVTTSAAPAGTVWKSTDKSASIVITNNGLTAASVGGVAQSVRSSTSKSSGKVYFEALLNSVTNDIAIGIANAAFNLAAPLELGSDANGVGYYPVSPAQYVYVNNIGTGAGNADVSGAIVSIAIDLTAKLFWVTSPAIRAFGNTWNSSATANPATGVGGVNISALAAGPYFVTFNDDIGGASATLNFGASTFSRTVPSGFSGWDAQVSTTVPGQVSNVVASAPTASSITLTWSAPITGSSPFSYQVQYRVHGGTSWTNFGSTASSITQIINGLQPSTSYDFQVYAINGSGNGTPSAILTSSTADSNAATTWNAGDKSSTITLSGGNLVATSATTVPQSVRSTTTKSTGKVYFEVIANTVTTNYTVGICNSSFPLNLPSQLGSETNGVGFYPVSPTNAIFLNGADLSQGSHADVNAAVIAVAFDATNHLIWFSSTRMRADGFPWNNSTTANPATGTGGISLAGLAPGPYYVVFNTLDNGSVATVNFGATTFAQTVPSGFVGWNSTPSATVPGTTTLVSTGGPVTTGRRRFSATLPPASITATSIPLTWNGPTTGSLPYTYQVQYRLTDPSNTTPWTNFSPKTSVASQNITGLIPNTTYDFQVYAINSAGAGTPSPIYTASTIALQIPATITLDAVETTATTAVVSWETAASGTPPIEYTAQYRVHGDATWITVPSTSGLTTTVTGLLPSNSYDFSVFASNATGSGAASSIITTNTLSAGSANPTKFTQNLNVPWQLNWFANGIILVSQRDSFDLAYINGNMIQTIAVPGTVTTQGDGGLMGVAIDPMFASNHHIYIVQTSIYNNGYTAGGNEVVRYLLDTNSYTLTSPTILLTYDASTNHNGGYIAFGPDGKLYISTGDAQQPLTTSQNLSSLNGKILRINADGSIPDDNPFNTDSSLSDVNPNGTRSAIWAFGFRRPHGFCWQGNTMWGTEVGPRGETFGAFSGLNGFDKINQIVRGGNYGFPLIYGSGSVVDAFGNRTITPALCSGDGVYWSPQGICANSNNLYFGALGDDASVINCRGVNQVMIAGTTLSSVQTWFLDSYGRVRDVAIGPDGLMYFTTSNNDGEGTPLPDDDHIYQVVVPGTAMIDAPNEITNLTITGTTRDRIGLSWAAPTVGTSPFVYQVQYKITSTATFLNYPRTTTATTQTIDALQPNTEYDFRVIAANATYQGSASTTLSAITSNASNPQLLPSGYLSTNGNQFIDNATGLPVRIAAVTWAGAEYGNGMPFGLWQVNYQTILNSAKAAGFNAIRFQFSDQALDLSPGPSTDDQFGVSTTLNPGITAGMSTLQMWDMLFDYCAHIGLKVWLAKMGNTGPNNKSGLWYGDGGYSAATCAAHLISLAQHFANNPTVIAIELNNQEFAPNVTYGDGSATDIMQMWQDVGNAINTVNPDIMVFCQGPQGRRSAPDYLANGACDLANLPALPVLNVPNKLAMSVRSFPNSLGNPAFLTDPAAGSLDYSAANLQRTFGYIFTNGMYPVIVSSMGSCRDGGNGNATGVLDVAGNADWLNSITNFIATGIGGIPPGGYGPSWAWSNLNPSGPNSGFGEVIDAGQGIISYNDNTTVLDPPFSALKPILYFG